MTRPEQHIFFTALRQGIYNALLVGVVIAFWGLTQRLGVRIFEEFGLIENLQTLFLGLSVGSFLILTQRVSFYRPMSLFLCSLCIAAMGREADAFFDTHLPLISWKFVFLFPMMAGYYLLKHPKQTRQAFFSFLQTPAFYMLSMSIVLIVAIGQCMGHKAFLSVFVGNAFDARMVRRLIEELSELLGYILIFLASVEFYFECRRHIDLQQKNKSFKKKT